MEELKAKLNESLKVVSTTQQYFKRKNKDGLLPAVIPDRIKFKTDRFQSERLRYQKNLHTIIFEIKEKMSTSNVVELKSLTVRTNQRYNPLMTLPVKDKHNFKIQTLSLSPVKTKHN